MTVKFNHTAHKQLWDWLAQHPDKHTSDWPGWIAWNRSFACQYSIDIGGETGAGRRSTCKQTCPLIWPNFACYKGWFELWVRCRQPCLRRRVAQRIRDLPVKPDIECV